MWVTARLILESQGWQKATEPMLTALQQITQAEKLDNFQLINTHLRSGDFGELIEQAAPSINKRAGGLPVWWFPDESDEWMDVLVAIGSEEQIITELRKAEKQAKEYTNEIAYHKQYVDKTELAKLLAVIGVENNPDVFIMSVGYQFTRGLTTLELVLVLPTEGVNDQVWNEQEARNYYRGQDIAYGTVVLQFKAEGWGDHVIVYVRSPDELRQAYSLLPSDEVLAEMSVDQAIEYYRSHGFRVAGGS